MTTLNNIKNDEKVIIKKINMLSNEKKHLEDMGFVHNSLVYVISNNDGDIICYVMNSRIGVTRNVAKNIYVDIIKK